MRKINPNTVLSANLLLEEQHETTFSIGTVPMFLLNEQSECKMLVCIQINKQWVVYFDQHITRTRHCMRPALSFASTTTYCSIASLTLLARKCNVLLLHFWFHPSTLGPLNSHTTLRATILQVSPVPGQTDLY